jgi:hypothetical protein
LISAISLDNSEGQKKFSGGTKNFFREEKIIEKYYFSKFKGAAAPPDTIGSAPVF